MHTATKVSDFPHEKAQVERAQILAKREDERYAGLGQKLHWRINYEKWKLLIWELKFFQVHYHGKQQ